MNGFYWIYLGMLGFLLWYDRVREPSTKRLVYYGAGFFLILLVVLPLILSFERETEHPMAALMVIPALGMYLHHPGKSGAGAGGTPASTVVSEGGCGVPVPVVSGVCPAGHVCRAVRVVRQRAGRGPVSDGPGGLQAVIPFKSPARMPFGCQIGTVLLCWVRGEDHV